MTDNEEKQPPPVQADRDEFSFEHPKEVMDTLTRIKSDTLSVYETMDEKPLKDALSKKFKLPESQIFLEQGTIGVIHHVMDTMIGPERRVLLPHPSYPYYWRLAKHHKNKIDSYDIIETGDHFEHGCDKLIEKLRNRLDLAVIVDPESPLGCSIPEEKLIEVLSSASEETLILIDQAQEGFRTSHIKDPGELVNRFPNLIIGRSFSKYFGLAALRVGYGLCGKKAKEMIGHHERYLGFNRVSQRIASACLENERYYQEKALEIIQEKARMIRKINELPGGYKSYKTDTIFILVRPPAEHRQLLENEAKRAGIKWRDISDYYDPSNEPETEGLLRITVGHPSQNDRVLDLIESVAWVSSLHSTETGTKTTFNTREEGYTVHRKEINLERCKMKCGYYKVIIPPGHKVSAHKHNVQDEFFHFMTPASISIDGHRRDTKKDEIVQIRAGQAHEIRAPVSSYTRYLCVRLPYDHIDKLDINGQPVVHKEEVDKRVST